MFTGGNIETAKKIMIPRPEIRKQELVRLSFYGGFLLAVILALVIALANKMQGNLMINGVPANQ